MKYVEAIKKNRHEFKTNMQKIFFTYLINLNQITRVFARVNRDCYKVSSKLKFQLEDFKENIYG